MFSRFVYGPQQVKYMALLQSDLHPETEDCMYIDIFSTVAGLFRPMEEWTFFWLYNGNLIPEKKKARNLRKYGVKCQVGFTIKE